MLKMRVKINNIDEFCEALKAGFLIVNYCCDNLKLEKDKILIRTTSAGKAIEFKINEFYYYKPNPLKIECGKYYKTRNGKKICICYKKKGMFIGLEEGCDRIAHWYPDGSFIDKSEDIVSEWKEDK